MGREGRKSASTNLDVVGECGDGCLCCRPHIIDSPDVAGVRKGGGGGKTSADAREHPILEPLRGMLILTSYPAERRSPSEEEKGGGREGGGLSKVSLSPTCSPLSACLAFVDPHRSVADSPWEEGGRKGEKEKIRAQRTLIKATERKILQVSSPI